MSEPSQLPPPSTGVTDLGANDANASTNLDTAIAISTGIDISGPTTTPTAAPVIESPKENANVASKSSSVSMPSLPPEYIVNLSADDAEFEHISQLDANGTTLKLPTSNSYHSPVDLKTIRSYGIEIDNIMSQVRQIGISNGSSNDEGESRIIQLCSKASFIEEKRKKLQDQIDTVQKTVESIQASLEKVNMAVTYWENQRDFIRVGRWIVIQKKAMRVLGIRDLKELKNMTGDGSNKDNSSGDSDTATTGKVSDSTDGNKNANGTKRKRSRNLPTSSQIRASIEADEFVEAASIMIAGGNGIKRRLIDVDSVNDTGSSPHHPSKKAKMVNLFNFYLSGGEKKQVNLHEDGFKLLYERNDPNGAGVIVCSTCNNKRVGQPRRMMRHAKSKRHQKNLAERRRLAAANNASQMHQVPVVENETVAAAIEAAAATSGCITIVGQPPEASVAVPETETERSEEKSAPTNVANSGADIGVDELNNLMEL